MANITHQSDCASCNAPAYEVGVCDCGAIPEEFVPWPDLPRDLPVANVLNGAQRCVRLAVVGVTASGEIYVAGSDGPVAGTTELLSKGLAWLTSEDDQGMEFH